MDPTTSAAAKPARRSGGRAPVAGASGPPGVHVLPAPRRRLPLGTRLLGTVVLAVVVLLALWWVWQVAIVVLRFVELGAAMLFAGYVGWRLGVRHGRHTR